MPALERRQKAGSRRLKSCLYSRFCAGPLKLMPSIRGFDYFFLHVSPVYLGCCPTVRPNNSSPHLPISSSCTAFSRKWQYLIMDGRTGWEVVLEIYWEVSETESSPVCQERGSDWKWRGAGGDFRHTRPVCRLRPVEGRRSTRHPGWGDVSH